MQKFKEWLCKVFGHKFIVTSDNNYYYISTCLRCNCTKKIYHLKRKEG